MRVLVLGAGPAGLMAAAAVEASGHEVLVYSKGRAKSKLYGCQYLHQPIPEFTRWNRSVVVTYALNGSAQDYKSKVYRSASGPVTVSPEALPGQHRAWDIRDTYDRLWEHFDPIVHEWDANVELVNGFIKWADPDLVISSVPRNLLCTNHSHVFRSEEIWAIGDAPDRGQMVPIEVHGDNIVQCDGTNDHSWYRLSKVFGHATLEWPGNLRRPPFPGVARVQKPLDTSCDCERLLPKPTLLVGRYGRWQKGILSHEAYFDTLEWIKTDKPETLF